MSRKRKSNKTGRGSNVLSDFVALERYVIRSEAWHSLTCLARAALIQVQFRYTGENNGSIQMSCAILAKELGLSKDSAARALRELLFKGFIGQTKGATFNSKIRHCAEYRLTAFRCNLTGDLPPKTFMLWKAKIQNTVRSTAHHGTMDETEATKTGTKALPRYDASDCEASKRTIHGTTHRTLLYSNHTVPATHTAASDGAGKPKAREQRGTDISNLTASTANSLNLRQAANIRPAPSEIEISAPSKLAS